jgi:hypothetical protein
MALARTCRRPFRPAARLRWMGDRLEDRGVQPVERGEVLAALPLHLPGHAGVVGGPAGALIQPAELQDLDVVNARHRGGDLVAEGGILGPLDPRCAGAAADRRRPDGASTVRSLSPDTLLAFILPRVPDILLALLVGAALAPTDAALGAGMMVNRPVPGRIRPAHQRRERAQRWDRRQRRPAAYGMIAAAGAIAVAVDSVAGLSLLVCGGLEFRHRGFAEGKPAGPEWLGTSGVIQWCTAASSAA